LSRHLHQSCILYLGLISGLAASFSAVLWLSVPFYRDGGGRGGAAGVVLAGCVRSVHWKAVAYPDNEKKKLVKPRKERLFVFN
jgi:hypothetical protein